MAEIRTTNPTHDLFFYALHGDVQGILNALDAGANPNAVLTETNFAAISMALARGSEETLRQVWITMLGNLGEEYHQARTPLFLAAEFDHYDAVLMLLERGADPNFTDQYGVTPLWAATQRNQTDIARLLLRAGANVHAADCEGETPLFRAVNQGNQELVRLLLAAGADAKVTTQYGITPLLIAARRGQDILVAHEDAPRRRDLFSDWHDETEELRARYDSQQESGSEPIALPAKSVVPSAGDYPAIVSELLVHGADVHVAFSDKTPSLRNRTALQEAAELGDEEVASLLLTHGAGVNEGEGDVGNSLCAAAFSGNIDLVRLLLKKGANINSANRVGCTALTLATHFGHMELVRFLVENGADVSVQRNWDNATLNHTAARSNLAEAIQLFIDRGVAVDDRDTQQQTPLIIAARRGSVDAAAVLIEAEADIHARDGLGKTAWDWARMNSFETSVSHLTNKNSNEVIIEFLSGLTPHSEEERLFIQQIRESMTLTEEEKESAAFEESEKRWKQTWGRLGAEKDARRATIAELLQAAGAE